MSDYRRGTGVSEHPPIIGGPDNQISLCLRLELTHNIKLTACSHRPIGRSDDSANRSL